MPTSTAKSSGSRRPRRDTTINLRVSAEVRDLIDTAAAARGTTRTEFVLESARRHAIDVMLDQRLLTLEPEEWRAFNRALDKPPLPNARLRDLMARKPPWRE